MRMGTNGEGEVVPIRDGPRIYSQVGERSLTQQSMKDECDVNLIVARHAKTGAIPHITSREPVFGDFTDSVDLKQSLDNVMDAQERFSRFPSRVRQAAQNDPVRFLEMLATQEGSQYLYDAGLELEGFERPEVEAPAAPAAGGEEEPPPAGE